MARKNKELKCLGHKPKSKLYCHILEFLGNRKLETPVSIRQVRDFAGGCLD
jgi:hypothetical protein